MQHDVFISYAFEDKAIADAICSSLEKNGIKCWIAPRDILPGQSYGGAIIRAINQCHIFLLVLSSNSNASPFVLREIERVVSKEIPLLPFQIEEVTLSDGLEFFIGVAHRLMAVPPPVEKHFGQLIQSIREWTSRGSGPDSRRSSSPISLPPPPPPPEVKPDTIITQVLRVSYMRNYRGREGLLYSPLPLPTEPAPDPAEKPIVWNSVRMHWQKLQRQIDVQNRCGASEQRLQAEQVLETAKMLSRELLPPNGLAAVLSRGVHPQFDIIQDVASQIPWEILQENILQCPNCGDRIPYNPGNPSASFCPKDRTPGCFVQSPLVLNYQTSYLLRGEGSPLLKGKTFLIIDDPTGELGSRQSPSGPTSRNHISRISSAIRQLGYTVLRIGGGDATVRGVKAAISNPDVVGIYYFGQGFFPRIGQEGCLILNEGCLFARDINEAAPTAKFVFINACTGPAVSDWTFDRRTGSVAEAFACNDAGKVVIAPIWPLAGEQAARLAEEFFSSTSSLQGDDSAILGAVLHKARKLDYARFQNGEPTLAWMAYRYLGNPNKGFPKRETAVFSAAEEIGDAHLLCRVFDNSAHLNTEIFAFNMDAVLLRAVRRRNMQTRICVSVSDFIGGMVRIGNLVRHLIRRQSRDPDSIYAKILNHPESESRGTASPERAQSLGRSAADPDNTSSSDETQLHEALDRWIVRREEEFDPQLVDILINADEYAQNRNSEGDDSRINEQDVLQFLFSNPAWDRFAILGLPCAAEMEQTLAQPDVSSPLDENGTVSLDCLNPEARQIIQTAHTLAQQRGVCPITNRLLMAAFFAEAEGCASRLFRAAHGEPELVFLMMIAATEDKGDEEHSFALSPEACSRIISPVLEEARNIARDPQGITARELFAAFCKKAPDDFKEFLRQLDVDLDVLAVGCADATITPPPDSSKDLEISISGAAREQYEGSAWQMILQSGQAALSQGWTEIRSPHLFAGMLEVKSSEMLNILKRNGINPQDLIQAALSLVPVRYPAPAAAKQVTLSNNADQVLRRAGNSARAEGRTKAAEKDLFKAFFSDGGGVVGQLLERAGLLEMFTSGL